MWCAPCATARTPDCEVFVVRHARHRLHDQQRDGVAGVRIFVPGARRKAQLDASQIGNFARLEGLGNEPQDDAWESLSHTASVRVGGWCSIGSVDCRVDRPLNPRVDASLAVFCQTNAVELAQV